MILGESTSPALFGQDVKYRMDNVLYIFKEPSFILSILYMLSTQVSCVEEFLRTPHSPASSEKELHPGYSPCR